MTCYHPMKAFPIGLKDNGKKNYLIASYKCHHIEFDNKTKQWRKIYTPGINPGASKVRVSFETLPCGCCIGCRLDYSKMWSIRCLLEMKEHKENSFITLTYDDDHLPKSFKQNINDETGEVSIDWTSRTGEFNSLNKKDLQDFWKRLRKALGEDIKIRYYACGEYGDNTARSHYHSIIFGYKPDDLKFYKRTKQGDLLYTSEFLNSVWQNGNVIIGDATYESAAYVARYIMKKLKGQEAIFYEYHGLEKPFVTMSRKPGIARDYYELHKDTDLFLNNHSYISTSKGSTKFKPFKYYKELYEEEYPGDLHYLTDKQKEFAKSYQKLKESKTDKSFMEMLESEEFILEQNSKKGRNYES